MSLMVDRYSGGILIVAADRTVARSLGRLYLQFPEEMEKFVGRKFLVAGQFSVHGSVMLVANDEGRVITPRRQMWWKNGVRDHGIRQDWYVNLYVIKSDYILVELQEVASEIKVIQQKQMQLFE